jgi:hypothetical protein
MPLVSWNSSSTDAGLSSCHVPRVYLSSTFGVLRQVVAGRLGVLHRWMGLVAHEGSLQIRPEAVLPPEAVG